MNHRYLDPATGAILAAEQCPAYCLHPSRYGRVVTLIPLQTFTAPVGGYPSPAPGRSAIVPPQVPEAGIAGSTPEAGHHRLGAIASHRNN